MTTTLKHLKPHEIETDWSGAILLHGWYGHGKTHFAFDALKHESAQGKVYFANIHGEDGCASGGGVLDHLDYPAIYDIHDDKAANEFIQLCQDTQPHMVALDSLPFVYTLYSNKVTGGKHQPESRGWGDNDFVTINYHFDQFMIKLKKAAKYVLVLSPCDTAQNSVLANESIVEARKMITPDLPGKLAHGCTKWFYFVGYLKVDGEKGTPKQRRICFARNDRWLTRPRFLGDSADDIVIPDDHGGWHELITRINTQYTRINQR